MPPTPQHYFARALLVHPGLSAAQDECDWLKKYKQGCVFSPYTRMTVSRARPFSSAGTVLKRSVEIQVGLAMGNYITDNLPTATTGSAPGPGGPVMKSPIRAGRSYTQLGNTGLGWVGFFLLCRSLSIFLVTSADCGRQKQHKVHPSRFKRSPAIQCDSLLLKNRNSNACSMVFVLLGRRQLFRADSFQGNRSGEKLMDNMLFGLRHPSAFISEALHSAELHSTQQSPTLEEGHVPSG